MFQDRCAVTDVRTHNGNSEEAREMFQDRCAVTDVRTPGANLGTVLVGFKTAVR